MLTIPANQVGLNAKLSPTRLRSLLKIAQERTFQRGQVVFEQDDEASELFIVRKGVLEVSTLALDGRKHILNVVTKGNLFGEIALLDGGKRSATITALEPTRLLSVSRRVMMDQMQQHPDFGLDLISLTVARLRWVISAHEEKAFQPLEVRLARRLIYLEDKIGTQSGLVALSQNDIAEHVGASREAASKCLAEWQRRGVVKLGRKRIEIINNTALSEIAEGVV